MNLLGLCIQMSIVISFLNWTALLYEGSVTYDIKMDFYVAYDWLRQREGNHENWPTHLF